MIPTQPHSTLCRVLTPELRSIAIERTESTLLSIVRSNFHSKYASKVASLAELRDAVSAHGSGADAVLVQDFRRWVPLSEYDSYKPFMAVFDERPCKEAEAENLFAPGLPSFLAMSSATSGRGPKLFPKYHLTIPNVFNPQGLAAAIIYCGYRETKEIEREPGQIVKRIPVSTVTGALLRTMMGWTDVDDDDGRLPTMLPGIVAPWAATMIKQHRPFLMVHALFALACRDLEHINSTFSTLLYDLIRHIDEEWDLLLSSIRDGTIPDLPGVDDVRSHLQTHVRANPERAAELREVGPPFSCEGWAARIWPNLKYISVICSGPFSTVLPKIKSVIGPTIALRSPNFGSSESVMATPHGPDDLDTFVFRSNDLIEFLDVTAEESHENLLQPWELDAGKKYEIVLTTNDGLWRYRLGDVVEILGFDVDTGSPVFMISGRRSLSIRFPGMLVTDTHLTPAIQSLPPDVVQVNEFTTLLDNRQSTETVGFFVELAGPPGPNAHLAPLKLAEGLAAISAEWRGLLDTAKVRRPTVRILRPGTFSEYRLWRAEKMSIGMGQVKVPVVLVDPAAVEWILERVAGEL